MAVRVLAGDVGGTKSDLALYAVDGPHRLSLLRAATFSSRAHPDLQSVVRAFLAGDDGPIAAAAFGLPGPVVDGAVATTNLPWRVAAADLGALLGVPVALMNDLQATAFGCLFQPPEAFETLAAGRPRAGNAAVIAAGTGLGQAFLFWDGTRHHAAPTEGGHADFAPHDEREWRLLRFLQRDRAHVSWEHVVSGPGLHDIFRFLTEAEGRPIDDPLRAALAAGDPSAAIGAAAVAGTSATAAEAVELFVSLYGAQAGNLALTVMATGGVFVGGGIVVKLLTLVAAGGFMRAFTAKGRFANFLSEVPVRVVLDPATARVGCAHAAADLL